MEANEALTEIARRVEGALERLDQRPPARDPHPTSHAVRERQQHELKEIKHAGYDGDTTETDSDPGEDDAAEKTRLQQTLRAQRDTHSVLPSPETTVTRPTRATTRHTAPSIIASHDSSDDVSAASSPTPTPKKAYRRPTPGLLTSRVAAAIIAREKPAGCDLCEQAFTTATATPASQPAATGRSRCACCKRQLGVHAFSNDTTQTTKSEIRCLDCGKAGARGLERLRKTIAEKKRLANEKRKATMAKKKQQREEHEQNRYEASDQSASEQEDPVVAKQRKRREQLSQRNFATFSRLILADMGVGDVEGGLERLREDRARRGGSLVGTKRRARAPRDSSSDDDSESDRPPAQARARAGNRRTGEKQSSSRAGKVKPSNKKTKTSARSAVETGDRARAKRRAPSSPEVIEIEDSD